MQDQIVPLLIIKRLNTYSDVILLHLPVIVSDLVPILLHMVPRLRTMVLDVKRNDF